MCVCTSTKVSWSISCYPRGPAMVSNVRLFSPESPSSIAIMVHRMTSFLSRQAFAASILASPVRAAGPAHGATVAAKKSA